MIFFCLFLQQSGIQSPAGGLAGEVSPTVPSSATMWMDSVLDSLGEKDGTASSTPGSKSTGNAATFSKLQTMAMLDTFMDKKGYNPNSPSSGVGVLQSDGDKRSNGDSGDIGRLHEMLLNTSQPASPATSGDHHRTNDEQHKQSAFQELTDLRVRDTFHLDLATAVATFFRFFCSIKQFTVAFRLQSQPRTNQTSVSVMLTSVQSASSSSPTLNSCANVDEVSASMWGNLIDLTSLKPSLPTSGSSSSLGLVDPLNDSVTGAVAGSGSSCNTSTNSASSIMILGGAGGSSSSASTNALGCEDSYEAGIADGMRELELRLETELQLDENGI